LELEKLTPNISDPAVRDASLRHIANSLASLGKLEKAMAVLENVISPSEKMPVLMRTAEVQALAGDIVAATETAHSIEALRYRAIVLSTIGIEMARSGNLNQALEILLTAIDARQGIQYSFARDYASSRIALAYGKIAFTNDVFNIEIFNKAITTAKDINDQQLHAKTIWMLAFYRLDSGGALANETKDQAIAATGNIESTTSQAWLLADLSEQRAKSGKAIWAKEIYDISLNIVRSIKSSWGRARVLPKLSQALMALAESPANK